MACNLLTLQTQEPAPFTVTFTVLNCLLIAGESQIDFLTQCVIITQMTRTTPLLLLPCPYYMHHFQIFDKIDSFLKDVSNVLDSKKGRLRL